MLKRISVSSVLFSVLSFPFLGLGTGLVWADDLLEIQRLRAEIQKVEEEYKQHMERVRNTLRDLRNRLKLLEKKSTHAAINTARSDIEKTPKRDGSDGVYFVQIGAYRNPRNAKIDIHRLEGYGFHTTKFQRIQIRGRWLTRVMVGPCATRREAVEVTERLKAYGISTLLRREYIRPAKSASPEDSVKGEEQTEVPKRPSIKRASGPIEVVKPRKVVPSLRSQAPIDLKVHNPRPSSQPNRKFMQEIPGNLTQMNDRELGDTGPP